MITLAQIRLMRHAATCAGDYDHVRLCDRALGLPVRVFGWEVSNRGGYVLAYHDRADVTVWWVDRESGDELAETISLCDDAPRSIADIGLPSEDLRMLQGVVSATRDRDVARAECERVIEDARARKRG